MMDSNHPKRVEDYTTANMVLLFVNLLWIFGAVWTAWGIGAVMVLGAILNHAITRIEIARRRHAIYITSRGKNAPD
ncbi:histidinol phosphate aminotransferase [Thalassococcus lentus]|uniref:Histidinol phosphate aminotransferase n=1 Tax=Thalassococcus lentus TaxID=1210524 RepID=A0ABT4XX59_9RHOB|nr:histidinol phosphate aminotransferase [Thalassococcus lentus]MDA7426517.1 histidinol phosphate aminotransferase [Thalassococcus lentus]